MRPCKERPLPELWDGELVDWEDWERESDDTAFICDSVMPWEREELEFVFSFPAVSLPLDDAVSVPEPSALCKLPEGITANPCPHCGKPRLDSYTATGRTFETAAHILSAIRCENCWRDEIYTCWNGVWWVMEESDYTEENYLSEPVDWDYWKRRRRALKLIFQAQTRKASPLSLAKDAKMCAVIKDVLRDRQARTE